MNGVEIVKHTEARDKANKEKQDEVAKIQGARYRACSTTRSRQLQNSDKEKSELRSHRPVGQAQRQGRRVQLLQARRPEGDRRLPRPREPQGDRAGQVDRAGHLRHRLPPERGPAEHQRRDGAASTLMKFTVFDRDARGIPTDKPKGVVEIVSVGDPAKGVPRQPGADRRDEGRDQPDPLQRPDLFARLPARLPAAVRARRQDRRQPRRPRRPGRPDPSDRAVGRHGRVRPPPARRRPDSRPAGGRAGLRPARRGRPPADGPGLGQDHPALPRLHPRQPHSRSTPPPPRRPRSR